MADNVVDLNDENFQTEVLDCDTPVLVDFWAPWCGPCKMLAPTIEELATDFDGRVKVAKLNTDEAPQVSSEMQISAIPTVLLFKDGEVIEKLVGINPKTKFAEVLEGSL